MTGGVLEADRRWSPGARASHVGADPRAAQRLGDVCVPLTFPAGHAPQQGGGCGGCARCRPRGARSQGLVDRSAEGRPGREPQESTSPATTITARTPSADTFLSTLLSVVGLRSSAGAAANPFGKPGRGRLSAAFALFAGCGCPAARWFRGWGRRRAGFVCGRTGLRPVGCVAGGETDQGVAAKGVPDAGAANSSRRRRDPAAPSQP